MLKQRFLMWKALAQHTVSIVDSISFHTKSRGLQACVEDWAMAARKTSQEKMRAAVEKETQEACSQQEAERMQKERAEHEKVSSSVEITENLRTKRVVDASLLICCSNV